MKSKLIMLVVVSLLLVAGAGYPFTLPGFGKFDKVKAVNGVVTIPLARVNDGKAHYFSYSDDGKEIRFFIVKGGDGKVRSAFDSCDVCYKEKKGYAQQEDKMICRNCKMKFAINKIGPNATGGCNPSYLPHGENGNNLLLEAKELRLGSRFF